MALNAGTLEAALQPEIKTQMAALFTISGTFGADALDKFATAMATAIANKVVDHIKTNAVVSGSVTSGSGAGGAITGTVG